MKQEVVGGVLEKLALFLKRRNPFSDFLRETDELTLWIPALARPTLPGLQGKVSWIKRIERDTSPEGAIMLRLATVLRPNEQKQGVGREKYERRIAPKLDLCLGFQQAAWLGEHQDEFPMLMALALFGKIYIDFPGLVVVDEDGYRSIPYFGQRGTRWSLLWHWLDSIVLRDARLALSSK